MYLFLFFKTLDNHSGSKVQNVYFPFYGLNQPLKKNKKIYQHSAQGQLSFDTMQLVKFRLRWCQSFYTKSRSLDMTTDTDI